MVNTVRKIITGLAVAGTAAAISVASATTAAAQQYQSSPLAPGQGACAPAQYASFQVRADGWATWNGAKFKLLRNGVVVYNTPTRVNSIAIELRSDNGTFPGAGYYTWCAQNTGTTNTTATLQLRTDYEF